MPMKFTDDLYEYYKDRLTGELDRRDVLKLIGEMTDEELLGMFGLYVLESLKAKMAREGLGATRPQDAPRVH
ncbi:cytosolic protein [Geobacillus thermoleovorans]|uniref:cytosolic protein n=1 Tax=Geobacillus thermoleovorans TaxID=33941 RepID=UPI0009BEBA10|nr:cytosolic protein [Geobacillus thermoleovorans]OQP13086.1 cytosolic protein [Geobacillus thermoleovorans]